MRIGVKIMLILSKYSKNCKPNHFLKIQEYMILFCTLKGVFAKNERGYRLNAIKKRF